MEALWILFKKASEIHVIITLKISLRFTFLYCNFRYSIDQNAEGNALFSIDVDSGLIATTRSLDREEAAWHNITVMASEIGMYCSQARILSVFIDFFFIYFFYMLVLEENTGNHFTNDIFILNQAFFLKFGQATPCPIGNHRPWSLNHRYWPKQMSPWRSVALWDWWWGFC